MNPEQARHTIVETFRQMFDDARFLFFIRNLVNHLGESKRQTWTLKKGWFGVERGKPWGSGRKDFIRHLFINRADYAHVPGQRKRPANFFNDILEPLFYEAIAAPRTDDGHYYSRFDCRIPFLNGGLFEPLYGYNWVETEILLPDTLFANAEPTGEEDEKGTGIGEAAGCRGRCERVGVGNRPVSVCALRPDAGGNQNRGKRGQMKTPTAFRPSAQGCRAGEATLGRPSLIFFPTPSGLRPSIAPGCAATPLGLMNISIRFPRVARASQPWAERPYPFGVNPIPAAPPEKQKAVERLVDRILSAKQRDAAADVSALEREIDELVYALYGLTPEEIKIVEGAAK